MPANSKLRIGLISKAHVHAQSYARALGADESVNFVGIWDADERAGSSLALACGTTYFNDLGALLGQALDGVVVTSENANHRRHVEAAAAAGVKAILCEKPIATTAEDAQAMIDSCACSGSSLSIAFPCRFSPAFQSLANAVHSGKLGTVLAVRGTNHGNISWRDPEFAWFVDKAKSGGGAIIDHTVHVADLNRIMLGSEAVEVYAERGNNICHQSWEDTAFLTITYASGVFTTLDSSWSRPVKSFPTWGDVTYHVVGSKGVAELDLFGQTSTLHSESTGGTRYLGWGSNIDGEMITDFLRVARGEPPIRLATGDDGLQALKVALAAYESVRTGRVARV